VVFQAAVRADLIALAAIGIAASVIGAFYYLKFIKVMFFDEPTRDVEAESPLGHWVVLALCVAFISPLGYLVTLPLGDWAARAASAFAVAM
jgi:NADH-quinone oxidoreductase subunit N